MKVLFVTSEVVPFTKTGGLADVSYALPLALRKNGIDARIITTKAFKNNPNYEKSLLLKEFNVQVGWRNQYCGLLKLSYNDIPYYFIDNEYYFNRNSLYGNYDDGEIYSFFSKAVLESIKYMDDFVPDIIHLNDWHTGIISVLLNEKYKSEDLYKNIKTIFTIHNLKFQGIFNKSVLSDLLNLDDSQFINGSLEYYDNVNFMKGAINNSDAITTVSPTYSKEILSEFFGEGLHNVLKSKESKIFGILNGLDQDLYNPFTDSFIKKNYSLSSLKNKLENKLFLQSKLNLPENENIPIISMVSRFDEMKGFDLVMAILEELINENVQIVILGVGEKKYEMFFHNLQQKFPERISLNTIFNENLAHEIYAGSDMFLMPSKYEPCGLSQQISMRYGTIPIVRETGGLKDTVTPYNKYEETGNGFSFGSYNAHEMFFAIKRALEIYPQKTKWKKIMKSAMKFDSSWSLSSKKYIAIYQRILEENI